MNTRNYIELGVITLCFAAMLIWKIFTRKRVSKMDGRKGENEGVSTGKIVGKLGRKDNTK